MHWIPLSLNRSGSSSAATEGTISESGKGCIMDKEGGRVKREDEGGRVERRREGGWRRGKEGEEEEEKVG